MTTAEVIEEFNDRIEIIELIWRDYTHELPEYLEALKMAIDWRTK